MSTSDKHRRLVDDLIRKAYDDHRRIMERTCDTLSVGLSDERSAAELLQANAELFNMIGILCARDGFAIARGLSGSRVSFEQWAKCFIDDLRELCRDSTARTDAIVAEYQKRLGPFL